ncbi:uncharacterized protein LOC112562563 isoform X2 [Pomacea canaliculata]|uniref:uncharacterized protein LOC112562563 isoform X2 n=1 Tax=Pomacea canaliculata TaxID=400727 RepID=UPI000D739C62|nr:uncharacterized protein LOC112562563 isoform X2 [Pomacea canaliculata]
MAATWLLVTLIWACLKGMSVHTAETNETDLSIVTQCKGSNLTLHEATPRVTVRYVFRGGETLASASVPATGKLKGRLIVNSDGRVTLTDLKSHDLGTYGVEVQLAEDKRIHSIGLVVREPPKTVDGKLFVMKNYFSDSGSIHLTCGTFTTLGFPPVSAVWKDPAGRALSSDGFKDEYFYLDVPADTADSGDYCCQLDCRAPDFCCLDDQSPLRSCATVHVQTNKKVEVVTKESVSLEAFSQLQQQVLDLARSQQESHDGGCRQSAVTAIAHLAELQAKSDAYLNTVKSFEKELERSLENVKNISAEDRVKLQIETNQMLQNVQLQLDYNISKAMETCNDFQQQLRVEDMKLELNQTTLSTSVEALEQRLDKDFLEMSKSSAKMQNNLETNMKSMQSLEAQMNNFSKVADKRFVQLEAERTNRTANLQQAITKDVSKLEETLSALERKLSAMEETFEKKMVQQISDMKISFTQYQQTTAQELTDVRGRTDTRLSQLERRLSTSENTINSHVTSSSQSHTSLVSELAAFVRKTNAVTESLKNQLTTMNNQLTAKRCESGVKHFSPHDQPSDGSLWRTKTDHVDFTRPFTTKPTVAIGITSLDVSNWSNLRIQVRVGTISTSGFDVHASEWSDTYTYSVAAVWMACNV